MQIWRVLESVHWLTAVKAEWLSLLGGRYYGAVHEYLKPTVIKVRKYPCSRCDCKHRIEESDRGIRAFCECTPPTCPPIVLTNDDRIGYEFDLQLLASHLADILQIRPLAKGRFTDLPYTVYVGIYRTLNGENIPLVLTIQNDPVILRDIVVNLIAELPYPFVLVTPTSQHITSGCADVMLKHGIQFVSLDEFVVMRPNGRLKLIKPIAECLRCFEPINRCMPQYDAPETVDAGHGGICLPATIRWSDVRIRFKDGHTVYILVGDSERLYNFAQMGFADNRTGNPNTHWHLLYLLAEEKGVLYRDRHWDILRNRQRKRRLSDALKKFFKLAESPFRISDGSAWETKFYISLD